MAPLRDVLGDTFICIDHIGIAVEDLDLAIATWGNLGLAFHSREINHEQKIQEAMLDVIPDLDLQLLASNSPESSIAKFLESRGPGLQQIAVRVTDINVAMARVTNANLRLIYPEPAKGTAHSSINFIHPKDMGGVLVELVQVRQKSE